MNKTNFMQENKKRRMMALKEGYLTGHREYMAC